MHTQEDTAPVREAKPETKPPASALSATQKQLLYARRIAVRTGTLLPWDVQQDRHSLSRWIDAHAALSTTRAGETARPSSRQVGFAEKLARRKRTNVPDECFRSRDMMSRWIDAQC